MTKEMIFAFHFNICARLTKIIFITFRVCTAKCHEPNTCKKKLIKEQVNNSVVPTERMTSHKRRCMSGG